MSQRAKKKSHWIWKSLTVFVQMGFFLSQKSWARIIPVVVMLCVCWVAALCIALETLIIYNIHLLYPLYFVVSWLNFWKGLAHLTVYLFIYLFNIYLFIYFLLFQLRKEREQRLILKRGGSSVGDSNGKITSGNTNSKGVYLQLLLLAIKY